MKNLEIECKFDANTPHAFTRARKFVTDSVQLVAVKTLHITDTYLDHLQRDLAAQQIALRIRNTDGKWEATFKTRTEIKDGKAIRQEETLLLASAKNRRQALQQLAEHRYWQGVDVTALVPQFTLVNRRTVLLFNYKNATLEMALDNVTLHLLGRQVKFKEIEIELRRGARQALDNFTQLFKQQTRLKPAIMSKVKTAETLLQLWKE